MYFSPKTHTQDSVCFFSFFFFFFLPLRRERERKKKKKRRMWVLTIHPLWKEKKKRKKEEDGRRRRRRTNARASLFLFLLGFAFFSFLCDLIWFVLFFRINITLLKMQRTVSYRERERETLSRCSLYSITIYHYIANSRDIYLFHQSFSDTHIYHSQNLYIWWRLRFFLFFGWTLFIYFLPTTLYSLKKKKKRIFCFFVFFK